jgi:hypothetical protein
MFSFDLAGPGQRKSFLCTGVGFHFWHTLFFLNKGAKIGFFWILAAASRFLMKVFSFVKAFAAKWLFAAHQYLQKNNSLN